MSVTGLHLRERMRAKMSRPDAEGVDLQSNSSTDCSDGSLQRPVLAAAVQQTSVVHRRPGGEVHEVEPRSPSGHSGVSQDQESTHSTGTQLTISTAGHVPQVQVEGPHYSGWLGKRSAKLAPRWQQRWFTLEGAILAYAASPNAPIGRSFDVRRARRVGLTPGNARELELDFGVRAWRLRADTPETARRWLLMLDTARLVQGDVETSACGQDELSDGGSEGSTPSAASTTRSLPRSPVSHRSVLGSSRQQQLSGDARSVSGAESRQAGRSPASNRASSTPTAASQGGVSPWRLDHQRSPPSRVAANTPSSLEEKFDRFGAFRGEKKHGASEEDAPDGPASNSSDDNPTSQPSPKGGAMGSSPREDRNQQPMHRERCKSAREKTSKSNRRDADGGLSPPPVVVDQLELSSEDLDRKFQKWFVFPSDGNGADCRGGGRERRTEAAAACDGLECALHDLWTTISTSGGCRRDSVSPRSKSQAGPETALKALSTSLNEVPLAVGDAIGAVIDEYLVRIQARLVEWIGRQVVSAEDIAAAIDWLYAEAEPSLSRFAIGLGHKGRTCHWTGTLDALGYQLLAAWESKSCDDVSQKIEAAYAENNGNYRFEPETRAQKILDTLKKLMEREEAWSGHADALDRVATVVIGGLNTALRSFKKVMVPFRPKASPKDIKGKVIREITKRTIQMGGVGEQGRQKPAIWHYVAVSKEAASLAEFCADIQQRPGAQEKGALRMDVLSAFSSVFRNELSTLCTALVERHFARSAAEQLDSMRLGAGQAKGGCEPACAAAFNFIDSNFGDAPRLCRRVAADCAVHFLTQRLLRRLRHQQPSKLLSKDALAERLRSDHVALKALAKHFGASSDWKKGFAKSPLPPLRTLQEMLVYPDGENLAAGAADLTEQLDDRQARALVNAVRAVSTF